MIQLNPEQHLVELSVNVIGSPTHTGFGFAVKLATGAGSTLTVNDALELHESLKTVTE